jgi:hypothetical protein
MSRLRTNPKRHTCQQEYGGYGEESGICGELATIRCNHCKKYFCEECWQDHFEMTLTEEQIKVCLDAQEESLRKKEEPG